MCGDEVRHKKPDPEIYEKAVKLLHADKEHVLVLEDSLHGVRAACRAGIKTLMISDFVQPTEDILDMLYGVAEDLSCVAAFLEMEDKNMTINVNGGQFSYAGDNATINATQYNRVNASELDNIIKGIMENLSGLKKEDEEKIVVFYQISTEVAFWIYENNFSVGCISREKYEEICKSILKEKNDREINQNMIDEYFKSTKYFEGIETEELYFIHYSIYEYFVSQYIYSSMCTVINKPNELACILGKVLKRNYLSTGIKKFFKLEILNNELYNKFAEVDKAFQKMLQSGMTFYTGKCYKNVIQCELHIFANMLEIIHFWEKNYYKFDESISNYLRLNNFRLNLRKVDLSGMDLIGSFLFSANLEGANLTYANLSGSILYGTILKEADLSYANLNEIDLRVTNLEDVELNKVNLKDSKISERQVSYLQKKCDLKGAIVQLEKTENYMSYEYYCKDIY